MTQAPAPTPPVANFVNPDTMHRPTGYTHVVEVTAGRPVYISGQVAFDRSGTLVGPGDVRAQARQVYVNTARPPASTAVEVRRLVLDDLLIEVEAVAIVA